MENMSTGERTASRQQVMGRRLVRIIVLLLVVMAILAPSTKGSFAFAEDDLYLTGIIKSISPVTGLVYVEVASSSCRGMRTFRADQPDTLNNYVGQDISFFIDSNTCKDNAVHTILVSRGIRK